MTVVSLPPAVGTVQPRRLVQVRARLAGRSRVVAATTAAALLGAAAFVHVDARGDLQAERTALRQARLEQAAAADDAARSTAAVVDARAVLAEARTALDATAARVAGVQADLLDRTAERDDLRGRVRAATDELAGVRSTLVAGFEQLGLQGAQVASLDACLNGLSRALLQLAFEDDDGAARSLADVADPCAAASGALDVAAVRP